ncbi:MAG: flavin reductase family protein [Phycisphaerales bacterium]|nr:flavin reductase family protein [Phycisphaerales bacterium]
MTSLSTDREAIGAALGRIPGGAGILTSAHAGRATGMLVSWFQQVSFEPPMIAIALRSSRPIAGLIDACGALLLHVIPVDDVGPLFKHFGKGFSLGEDAFVNIPHSTTEFGPSIDGIPVALACRVRNRVEAGDHDLYLAEVVSARGDVSHAPYVHIRKTGLSY